MYRQLAIGATGSIGGRVRGWAKHQIRSDQRGRVSPVQGPRLSALEALRLSGSRGGAHTLYQVLNTDRRAGLDPPRRRPLRWFVGRGGRTRAYYGARGAGAAGAGAGRPQGGPA
jgi:hypothetical protein